MIKVEIDAKEVEAALRALQRRVTNTGPVMADVAQALASETERQFEREVGPDGLPWTDLSDVTKAMRTKRGKWPGKKLQVSAAGLAASVQSGSDRDSAWIGTNKPYGAIHQFGGTTSERSMIPGKTIPARPYLPVEPESGELGISAERTVLELLLRHLRKSGG